MGFKAAWNCLGCLCTCVFIGRGWGWGGCGSKTRACCNRRYLRWVSMMSYIAPHQHHQNTYIYACSTHAPTFHSALSLDQMVWWLSLTASGCGIIQASCQMPFNGYTYNDCCRLTPPNPSIYIYILHIHKERDRDRDRERQRQRDIAA